MAIHVPKAQLTKLTQESCSRKALADGLQTAYKRLRKHISDDSGLFLPLWDRIAALLFQRFARYEEVALLCYDVRLEPSANLVTIWLKPQIGVSSSCCGFLGVGRWRQG